MLMWKFFQKTKGVISIFLIIIMVPLFTSAVLLVDGTRYHSAKTLVQEAGDLAAYSTIANYNMDLKDEFGLFAIDDDNVAETFKKYYSDTLGYSASEGSYSDKVQSWISSSIFGGGYYADKTFFDIFDFQVDSATATPIYPLSNAAVLQNQIVEFSKYRAVETALERFEILKNFDEAKAETQDAQDTMGAVENLSNIEERKVGRVSGLVAQLKNDNSNNYVDTYNANLESLPGLVEKYCEAAAAELAALAVNSLTIYNKKEARLDAYEKVTKKLDDIVSSASFITNTCNTAETCALQAIEELEQFKASHTDEKYKDACQTADQDLNMLRQLIANDDSKYSLNNLKTQISSNNAETLRSTLKNHLDKMQIALQETYTKYQNDRTNASDKSSVRYHFYLKDGTEWFGTKEDHTGIGNSADDYLSSAGTAVTSYVGYNDFSANRIGTINLESYKANFANIFIDTADKMVTENRQKLEDAKKNDSNLTEEQKKEPKLESKDAADKANEAKKNGTVEKSEYKTISNEEAALLPSKCESEQTEMTVPDLGKDNASSMLNGAGSTANSVLGEFFESGRNDLLVYAYLLDNFKTRVTGQNINSDTDKSNIGDQYIVDWRYENTNGELDMRDRAKKDLDTFFATNEVEYVFGGCKSEFSNATIVYSWIYGTRLVNNFAAVYSAYNSVDSWVRFEIDILAAAASAATGGLVPFSVFKWVFITAWAAGETALDLALLVDDGYRIPLIKTKDNIFLDSVTEAGNAFSQETRKNYLRTHNGGDEGINKITVCYEDYLLILLAFVDRETRLERIGDLIQLNMRKRTDPDFLMSESPTYIKVDTTTSIKYLFQPFDMFKDSYNGTGLKYTNTFYQGY